VIKLYEARPTLKQALSNCYTTYTSDKDTVCLHRKNNGQLQVSIEIKKLAFTIRSKLCVTRVDGFAMTSINNTTF